MENCFRRKDFDDEFCIFSVKFLPLAFVRYVTRDSPLTGLGMHQRRGEEPQERGAGGNNA